MTKNEKNSQIFPFVIRFFSPNLAYEVYTCTRSHMYAHAHTCMHTLTHICTRSHMYAHTHTCMHTLIHICTRSHMYAHAHTCMHTLTHVCTRSHIYAHAHTCMHTLTHVCTHSHMYAHTHTCMHTLTHVCTRSHMYAHAHTCMHTLTHICTCTTVCADWKIPILNIMTLQSFHLPIYSTNLFPTLPGIHFGEINTKRQYSLSWKCSWPTKRQTFVNYLWTINNCRMQ